MKEKLDSIPVSHEQLAHDLAMFRLQSVFAEKQDKSIGEVFNQYIEGVETFKTLIEGYKNGSLKN
ncbi:hypothetical protein [Sporosarcina sp. FSL K6-2383]|uniref:hypothetical protein n=1 Tax=Sporosarcina sp. FSL K6-2383 TaxID=2921556 RepID=UPI003159B8DB